MASLQKTSQVLISTAALSSDIIFFITSLGQTRKIWVALVFGAFYVFNPGYILDLQIHVSQLIEELKFFTPWAKWYFKALHSNAFRWKTKQNKESCWLDII